MEKMKTIDRTIPSLEYVVLVDRQNNVLGTAPKLETHNENTPLHRGFSLFLFNSKGELLLQQRSRMKKTWALVWSNSVCGHPMLNESNPDAAKRRLRFELGLNIDDVQVVLPDFSYKAEMNGVVENELCPVMVAFTDEEPKLNRNEVEDIKWINWQEFVADVKKNPGKYSIWCEKETKLLAENEEFARLYKNYKK